MAKEVKIKGIEIGLGLFLYLNALFSVRHWDVYGKTQLILFLIPYLAMSVGVFWDMAKNMKKLQQEM